MSDVVDWKPLAEYIRMHLSLDPDQPIVEDTPLMSSGLVDSFSLVELNRHIEVTYGVRIPASRLTVENFDTVGNLVRLIATLAK